MKKLLLFVILIPLFSNGQSLLSINNDCGTWGVDTTYEKIVSTDTIKYIP